MGPIERELRALPCNVDGILAASTPAFTVLFDAALSLRYTSPIDAKNRSALADVMSGAIEAAEALGL